MVVGLVLAGPVMAASVTPKLGPLTDVLTQASTGLGTSTSTLAALFSQRPDYGWINDDRLVAWMTVRNPDGA